jgi:hypothetical protein
MTALLKVFALLAPGTVACQSLAPRHSRQPPPPSLESDPFCCMADSSKNWEDVESWKRLMRERPEFESASSCSASADTNPRDDK